MVIGTGPTQNRLDDAESVNAIPLSRPDIIAADSRPSRRYCVRSEFPVGRRLRCSNELSRSMLAASIALRFQTHDWAPAWPEGARYRAGRGNRLFLFVSQTLHAVNLADARGSLPTPNVGPKRASRRMPKNA